MQPYTVEGTGESRVLMLQKTHAHRFRFSQIIGKELLPVKFKVAGSKLVAVVSDCVMVYKLPNAHSFHKEYMAHNARAQWMGLESQPDRLVDNMMEYVESI